MRFFHSAFNMVLLLLPAALIGLLAGVLCGYLYRKRRGRPVYGARNLQNLRLQVLTEDFTVCRVTDFSGIDLGLRYCFIGKTDEENSLVCETAHIPANVTAREDGWCGLRIIGTLDFTLVGILADLSAVLAREGIGIFAVSTYNTDYIFLKKVRLSDAVSALTNAGYEVVSLK